MTVRLPRFGMGCSGFGNLYRTMSDGDATATVLAARAHGITFFDVAPHYGFGLAERRLGAGLRRVGGQPPIVSTKVGRLLVPTSEAGTRHGFVDADPFEPIFDYGRAAILASHAASLERLGLPRVDILLAHDLGALTHGSEAGRHLADFLGGGYQAMRALKAAGRIDAIGIGVNETAICETLLDEVSLDVILLAGRYTLLEQGALPLLDRCARLGVQVIAGAPFNSGLLVEAPDAGVAHYDYAEAPAEVVERAGRLRAACRAHGVPLAAAALAFPLGHPAVACILAGLSTPGEVAAADAWRSEPIPAALWAELRREGLIDPAAPPPSA